MKLSIEIEIIYFFITLKYTEKESKFLEQPFSLQKYTTLTRNTEPFGQIGGIVLVSIPPTGM